MEVNKIINSVSRLFITENWNFRRIIIRQETKTQRKMDAWLIWRIWIQLGWWDSLKGRADEEYEDNKQEPIRDGLTKEKNCFHARRTTWSETVSISHLLLRQFWLPLSSSSSIFKTPSLPPSFHEDSDHLHFFGHLRDLRQSSLVEVRSCQSLTLYTKLFCLWL